MFEATQPESGSGGTKKWVALFVVVAAAAVGVLLYTMSKGGAKLRAPVASAASAPTGPADPVHDLRVFTARMEKDPSGTTAVWLLDLSNRSNAYTYRDIQYETTYVGGDNHVLAVNKGTLSFSLAPGEEKHSELRDVLYPAGTAWYKFKITGANAKTQ